MSKRVVKQIKECFDSISDSCPKPIKDILTGVGTAAMITLGELLVSKFKK